MSLKVLNLASFIKSLEKTNKDFKFSAAKALTRTARAIAKDDLPKDLTSSLDRPTRFTKQGFYTQSATRDKLIAAVGIKDKQVEYMKYQVYGGVRKPKRKLLRLPADVELDSYGNIPRRALSQLISRAKAGKRVTKSMSRKTGVSSRMDLFYGDPGDGRPVGVYKRMRTSSKDQLIPVIVMPQGEARYSKRFDFHAAVNKHASKRLNSELLKALKETWS